MVMTPGFHPGDPGSIPLVGDFYLILIFIHIFNLVPNSLSAAYYNFQHTQNSFKNCQKFVGYKLPNSNNSKSQILFHKKKPTIGLY